jgi:transcription elongation factor GreA
VINQTVEETTFLTPDGLKKLQEELEHLRTARRQAVAARLHAAMEEGELLENAEYEDAKNEQAFVEGRIMELEDILSKAVLIDRDVPTDEVRIGAKVTIREADMQPETYHIVGSAEADPREGRISNQSPLGRALLGRKVGDVVTVNAPDGPTQVKVMSIK